MAMASMDVYVALQMRWSRRALNLCSPPNNAFRRYRTLPPAGMSHEPPPPLPPSAAPLPPFCGDTSAKPTSSSGCPMRGGGALSALKQGAATGVADGAPQGFVPPHEPWMG